MALRKIVIEGDDILNTPCKKVEKFDSRLATLLDDMIETLKDLPLHRWHSLKELL